jgi:hypothetical protein
VHRPCRAQGAGLEDLQKAAWYLNRRIEREQAAAFCSGCPHEGWHKGSPHWCYKFGKSTMGVTQCGEKDAEIRLMERPDDRCATLNM